MRLFESDALLLDEPALRGALSAQAEALRSWTPRRHHPHGFGWR